MSNKQCHVMIEYDTLWKNYMNQNFEKSLLEVPNKVSHTREKMILKIENQNLILK